MFETETQRLERAANEARAELDRLQAAEATETYTEVELRRRRDAVLAQFDTQAAETVEQVTQAGQRAEAEATRLSVDDPLTRLTPEQLAEAERRRWIIEEDATKLTYSEMLPRVRAALVSPSPAERALWHRYLGRRLEADQRAQVVLNEDGTTRARTTGQDPARGEAAGLYHELAEQVRDRAREARLAEVQNVAGEAASFELTTIRRLRSTLDGTLERANARQQEFYARSF